MIILIVSPKLLPVKPFATVDNNGCRPKPPSGNSSVKGVQCAEKFSTAFAAAAIEVTCSGYELQHNPLSPPPLLLWRGPLKGDVLLTPDVRSLFSKDSTVWFRKSAPQEILTGQL